jgi:ABC-type molybdate transport system substrate-binding protein
MAKKIILLLLTIIILTGCQSKSVAGETVMVSGGSYKNITPVELNTMLKNKDFVLVNVHIQFPGDIANTDMSIAYDEISAPRIFRSCR